MKTVFRLIMITMAVIFNCVMGGTLAAAVDIAPAIGAIAMNGVATVCGTCIPTSSFGAGVFTEAWTGYLVKAMRNGAESLGWYNKIKSFDQYAENDVIHLVHIGVDPTVLINNSSYPLQIETLADADKPIALDKYQTKPTAITDDEVRALSYDKMASVIERHKEAIDAAKYSKAIHALAPNANGNATPVIYTTGNNDDSGTRRTITRADIISLKKSFDDLKVPVLGRILVLCSDHINDLLLIDQKFSEQYYNYSSGKIANMYGFEIYEFQDCPYYNVVTRAKIAYGSSVSGHKQASVAFYAPRMMKANGTTKTYLSEAKGDPQNQQNLINFRTYSICLPMKDECIGAILSNVASSSVVEPAIEAVALAEYTKNGGTKHSLVTATGDWTVANDDADDSWFTVEKVGDRVCCVVAANLEADAPARSGSFSVTLTANPTVKDTITVSQAANV